MTAANRERSIKKTLTYEGGYTNHPADPGGPTNWGITIADARHYWKPNATAADVAAMPLSVAVDIYRQRYWAPAGCDDLPAGMDLVVFDFGVNSGVSRALAYLKATPSGTTAARINNYCDRRLAFLKALNTWGTFGKGWGSRVVDVRATALKMAAEAPMDSTGANRKPADAPGPKVDSGSPQGPKTHPAPPHEVATPSIWTTILGLLSNLIKKAPK